VLQKFALQAHGHTVGVDQPPAVVNVIVTKGVLVVVALGGGAFKHVTVCWLI
jgi:hypothetical protein